MEEHSTRVRLWLNRRIVKYELRRAILPILWFFRLYDCTICYSLLLNDSPIFPIIRFFRLLICDFSDSPSTTRFSDFSDYTILLIVSYSLIFPILWVLRDSPMILLIVILWFFRFSEFYAILRVLRDSPIFPIIRFFRLLFSDFSDSPSSTRFSEFYAILRCFRLYDSTFTNIRTSLFFIFYIWTSCIKRLLFLL